MPLSPSRLAAAQGIGIEVHRKLHAVRRRRGTGTPRLRVFSVAVLTFLIMLQGLFVGHELTHDSPAAFERCAICHITGHTTAIAPATADLIFVSFDYVAAWFPMETQVTITPLTFRRASRAPPPVRI